MQLTDDNFLPALVQTAPVGLCILDAATLVTEMVNDAFLMVAGRPMEAIQGRHYWDAFPEAKVYYEQALSGVVLTGRPYHADEVELMLIRQGIEEWVFVTFVYAPVFGKNGSVSKIAIWVMENTQQVKVRREANDLNDQLVTTNARLEFSNEELTATNKQSNLDNQELVKANQAAGMERDRLRQFITDAPAGICVLTGPELAYELVNPTYQTLLPGRALFGRSVFEAMPEIVNTPLQQELLKVYATGKSYSVSELLIPVAPYEHGPTVDRYFTFNYLARRNEGDEVDGILVFVYEVTEQVNARQVIEHLNEELMAANEEQAAANEELMTVNEELNQLRFNAELAEHTLRVAVEAANFGTWRIDSSTRELTSNARLKDLFGFETTAQPTLSECLGQITENYRASVAAAIEDAITEGGNYDLTYSIRGKHHDKFRWVRAVGSLQGDDRGELTAFTGVVLDVTEQKADDQRKNDFIAMVSHELKTPLTSLNGYLQILEMKAKNSGDTFLSGTLLKSVQQVKKMTTMINGFLNVSRLEAGKIQVDKQRFDMASLVKEVEDESLAMINTHKIEFSPAIETFVIADRDKIGQVLNNFISNAVKYSPVDSTIQVACVMEAGQAKVSVTDTGMGVASKDKDKLFDRFYRVKNNSLIAGFGIGLYLCKEIVGRHQGHIGVQSELGKGSTFWFTIPLAADA